MTRGTKQFIYSALILLFSFVFSLFSHAQDPAFEGALGFGQQTKGGQGGEIYTVTSLSDTEQQGTLRHAIKQKKVRIIQFAVSGIIQLTKPLKINTGHITIQGQTSPNGVAIVGAPFSVSANEVIIQHLRFRLGTYGYADDALTVRNSHNVIIDHCSISWGTDETASLYNNTNFTLQNSIISNSLNKSIHPKGDHGYGGIWGGRNASFINNLVANHMSRTPRLNGHRLKSPYSAEEEYVELVNNIIYNWGSNSVYGSENGRFSLVNNYYLPGPDTKAKRMLDLWFSDKIAGPQAYIHGNYYQGKNWQDDNLLGVILRDKNKKKTAGNSVPSLFSDKPIKLGKNSLLLTTPLTAQVAYKQLIDERNVGAFKTKSGKFHDSVDQQVFEQIESSLAGHKLNSGILDHEKQQIESIAKYHMEFQSKS